MKLTAFIILLLVLTSTGFSQLKKGDNLLGPSIGFWTYNSVPTFGANYENQIADLGDVATFGLGGIFRYTGWTDNYNYDPPYNVKYTYLIFGAQGNFNFNHIGDGKFVPFAGLVLGYDAVSYTVSEPGISYGASSTSGWWLWAQAGMRYFFTPKVAGVVRLGAGNFNFDVLELGVDFKF